MRTASDDDYAAAMLARALGKPDEIVDFLLQRGMEAPFAIWNPKTNFMEARNVNGTFAGQDAGWTEGSDLFSRFFASFSDWRGK
jgi:putative alpha-1,2-mannosidase